MNNSNNYKIGTVYFFKNGVITDNNLTITVKELEACLRDIENPGIVSIASHEELLTNPTNKQIEMSISYKSYLNQGYSIIRQCKVLKILPHHKFVFSEQKILKIILPKNVLEVDSDNIRRLFEFLKSTSNEKFETLENYYDNGPGLDYYESRYNRDIPVSIILDYYLREKTNRLTEEEKIMFQKYRNFNLTELLTEDNQAKYPVNNTNAGVIIITGEKTYSSTLKGMLHFKEFNSILNSIGFNVSVDNESILNMVNEKSYIFVFASMGTLIVYMPEERTNYQFEELKKITTMVMNINVSNANSNKPAIDVCSACIPKIKIGREDTALSFIDVGDTVEELSNYLDVNHIHIAK